MKIETIEQIEILINLLVANKIEILEVDNIKIVKTKHDYIIYQQEETKDEFDL